MLGLHTVAKKLPVELSLREALVVKGFLEGRTATDAMIAAGYSRSTSISRPYSVLEKSRVKVALREAMERQGLTTEQLAKTLHRGLNAKKVQRLLVKDTVQEFSDIDHATRHHFLETACRLRGEDPDRQTDTTTETFEQRIRRLRGLAPVR